ncbi:kynurenine formamidase [Maribacter vaceletii]|uniref:Kynurenine formamidase n=1 Tax=Maribacter vaceletii TaxID=1206816 RepID=A0A495EC15_9FLAO|nr:cyclase family protein [Maribacter vaceletii]RKR14415.1 kynurenine formamidase [Maribacter vaceletii]
MSNKKIIDLTLPINNTMSGVTIEPARSLAKDGWNATTLNLYSHSGTHMDAPIHFGVTPQTIDVIPANRFVSNAWKVDVTKIKPKELITIRHLQAVADKISPGDSILLQTGWSKKIGSEEYRNALPRISKELALWLGEKKVNIIGVEPPSVADVNNIEEVTEIHNILMKNDIIIIEGLTNLESLPSSEFTLVALPIKVENGDGAPARVIAIEK